VKEGEVSTGQTRLFLYSVLLILMALRVAVLLTGEHAFEHGLAVWWQMVGAFVRHAVAFLGR
jgi:hypothetical protein